MSKVNTKISIVKDLRDFEKRQNKNLTVKLYNLLTILLDLCQRLNPKLDKNQYLSGININQLTAGSQGTETSSQVRDRLLGRRKFNADETVSSNSKLGKEVKKLQKLNEGLKQLIRTMERELKDFKVFVAAEEQKTSSFSSEYESEDSASTRDDTTFYGDFCQGLVKYSTILNSTRASRRSSVYNFRLEEAAAQNQNDMQRMIVSSRFPCTFGHTYCMPFF